MAFIINKSKIIKPLTTLSLYLLEIQDVYNGESIYILKPWHTKLA